jgi:hypothetical protein
MMLKKRAFIKPKRGDSVKRRHSLNSGSFTVETALIFPIIILVLAGLILAMLLMYHKILLTKNAGDAAYQAATFRLANEGLYAHLMPQNNPLGEETFSEVVKKEESPESKCRELIEELATKPLGYSEREFKKIQVAVYSDLERGIIRPQETTVTVNFRNGLLNRDISITITQKMKIIFGTINLTGTAKASETEAPEFIRNIDLAVEYAQRVKKGLSKKLPDFGSPIPAETDPGGN